MEVVSRVRLPPGVAHRSTGALHRRPPMGSYGGHPHAPRLGPMIEMNQSTCYIDPCAGVTPVTF